MPIPSALRKHVDQELVTYCTGKNGTRAGGAVVLVHRWYGANVTLFEHCSESGLEGDCQDCLVARFHYDVRQGAWSLFCQDRNLRWFVVGERSFDRRFTSLLDEVERDPSGIFWGWRRTGTQAWAIEEGIHGQS